MILGIGNGRLGLELGDWQISFNGWTLFELVQQNKIF